MKKTIFLVLFLVPLLCCCSGRKDVLPVLRNISFVADIDFYNENYSCNAQLDNEGQLTLTVLRPEEVSGMKMSFSPQGVVAEYMGLIYQPKQGSLPVGSAVQTMYDIIHDINSHIETAVSDGQNCHISRKCDKYKYNFYFSPSGLPLYIEIPDESFKITFSDITVIL